MTWHAMQTSEVLHSLNVDAKTGLSAQDVLTRREQYGINSFAKTKGLRPLGLILNQFKSPVALILLCAGLVTALLREYTDAGVILLVLILNTTIGVFEEHRASHAFELLSKSYRRFATVFRYGSRHRVPVWEIVPGDIVLISQGDVVPADGRVLESRGLELNESALTGEWQGVVKNKDEVSEDTRLTERSGMLYMGTVAASGSGTVVITETGGKTELGKIAKSLQDPIRILTPFQKSIHSLARTLSLAVLSCTSLILIIGLSRGTALEEILLIAIAVAVSAIPEGLPVAVTTTLAIGLEGILKKGGLIRHLVAAETLGTITVILTDKTGTLTEGTIAVSAVYPASTDISERDVLRSAVYASDAFVEEKGSEVTIHGRPVEKAIVAHAHADMLFYRDLEIEAPRLDYLPFDAVNRFASSLHKTPTGNVLYVCGAPEAILGAATKVSGVELSDSHRKKLLEQYDREMRIGRRLIAVAYKEVSYQEIDHHRALEGLSFVGCIALTDPLRVSAAEAVRGAREAGARVIMATGDNQETARAIATEVGIFKPGDRVVTGDEFEHMSATEQSLVTLKANVFARMLPDQKRILLDTLRAHGEVVAMTGDGVNDTPALVAADIGIALGSGTDVARDASDMVLVNNDFSVIVSAIREGRRILDNLKKVIVHLISTSFTEIALIIVALALSLPLPLLPVQILWHNVLSEGLLTMAFAFEPAEDDVMHRPPALRGASAILSKRIKALIAFTALGSTISMLGLFFHLLSLNLPLDVVRSTIFAALTIVAIGVTIPIKNLRKPIHQVRPFSNPFLLLSFISSLILLFFAFYLAPLRDLLHLTELPQEALSALIIVGIVNIAIVEFGKYLSLRT